MWVYLFAYLIYETSGLTEVVSFKGVTYPIYQLQTLLEAQLRVLKHIICQDRQNSSFEIWEICEH